MFKIAANKILFLLGESLKYSESKVQEAIMSGEALLLVKSDTPKAAKGNNNQTLR